MHRLASRIVATAHMPGEDVMQSRQTRVPRPASRTPARPLFQNNTSDSPHAVRLTGSDRKRSVEIDRRARCASRTHIVVTFVSP